MFNMYLIQKYKTYINIGSYLTYTLREYYFYKRTDKIMRTTILIIIISIFRMKRN